MNRLLIIPALLIVAGCAKINAAVEVAASADARLRDKCAYLESGMTIAEAFLGVVPSATNIVRTGAQLATDFCSGRPVTDFASAMEAMERIIVAVRPLATKASQNR